MFELTFEDFKQVYDDAITAIVSLRESAQYIKEKMDEIIDSCETIEGEL